MLSHVIALLSIYMIVHVHLCVYKTLLASILNFTKRSSQLFHFLQLLFQKLAVKNGTVEPRLSGPPLSGTSIIRLGGFLFNISENGRVPQMRMRVAAVTMETCLLIFCACADNHVALLFINKVGGSRRGLSIRLSGIFTYPACFWNQGVRIIEVLYNSELFSRHLYFVERPLNLSISLHNVRGMTAYRKPRLCTLQQIILTIFVDLIFVQGC